MIRFTCPTCKLILEQPENQAGTKINCAHCGQRLQIPAAERNKTILAERLPAALTPAPRAPDVPPASFPPTQPPVAAPPPATFHCLHAGRNVGPYTKEAMKRMLVGGQLVATDKIWDPALQQWIPLSAMIVPKPAGSRISRKQRSSWGLRGAVAAGILVGLTAIGGLIAAVLLLLPSQQPLANPPTILAKATGADKQPPAKADADLPKAGAEFTPEEIVAKREQSVALITVRYGSMRGSGTGFLVRPGILVTNYHVVQTAHTDHLSIVFPSAGEQGKRPLAIDHVLFFDRALDLALVSLKTPLPPLPLAPNYQFKRAQNIVVIGNPGFGGDVPNIENAVSRGITSTEVSLEGVKHYQLDITVNPGNSGGPVFDGTGRVIGVIKSKASKQERISFCIPVQELEVALGRAERLGQEEREKVTARFNARTLLRRMNWSALISDFGTLQIEKAWQEAIKLGQPVDPAITNGRQRFIASLKPLARAVWDSKDIASQVARIKTNPLLPELTRQQLAELWQTHEGIWNSVFFVEGRLADYARRNDENIKRSRDLVQRLRLTLDCTEEELLIPPS